MNQKISFTPFFKISSFVFLAVFVLFTACKQPEDPVFDELLASAGEDATICLGESVLLGGTPSAQGGDGNYSFSWNNNAGSEANPMVSPTETTTYTLTVIDGTGKEVVDDITITVAETFTADAGNDQAVLAGSSVSLGGSPVGSGTSTYTYSWNDGKSEISSEENPNVTPTKTTTYEVVVTDANGCTATDIVTITVSDFMVEAGSDTTICLGTSYVLGGTPTVSGDGTYTYSWNDGITEVATTENPSVSPSQTTTYEVLVTDQNGVTQTDQVTIAIAESFTVDAGLDQKIIIGELATLEVKVSGNGTYSYSWDNNAGTTAMVEVSPTVSTTYTVTVTDEYGCSETDEVTIAIADFTVDAGNDQTICLGNSVNLGGSPTATGPGSYSYSWSVANSVIATEANPNVTPSQTTTYSLVVTDNADGFTISDEVVITVAETYTANAGSDVTICPGEPVQLGGSPAASGNGNYTYSWNDGNNEVATTANPNVSPITTTTYTLTVTDGFGCSETDEIVINVSPDFTVDAGNSQQICEGEIITLGGSPVVTGPGAYTYSWSDGTAEISTDANPTLIPAASAVYTVTVTDENGCSKTSSVEIGVTPVISGSVTFNYTGAPQTFTFPDCITEVRVEVYGAQGQDGESLATNEGQIGTPGVGGNGALSVGTIMLNLNLGNTLNIYVGGQDGYNGGGLGGQSDNPFGSYSDMSDGGNGGGASDIRYGGVDLLDRIIVAGGGGGGGGAPRGALAAYSGSNGGNSNADGINTNIAIPGTQAEGGKAPVNANGGVGGNGFIPPQSICSGLDGTNGLFGIGGNGGNGGYNAVNCPVQGAGGGGGGGGYYGGGGAGAGYGVDVAASVPAAGGGGGSSYIGGVTNGTIADGVHTGNGKIVISWGN